VSFEADRAARVLPDPGVVVVPIVAVHGARVPWARSSWMAYRWWRPGACQACFASSRRCWGPNGSPLWPTRPESASALLLGSRYRRLGERCSRGCTRRQPSAAAAGGRRPGPPHRSTRRRCGASARTSPRSAAAQSTSWPSRPRRRPGHHMQHQRQKGQGQADQAAESSRDTVAGVGSEETARYSPRSRWRALASARNWRWQCATTGGLGQQRRRAGQDRGHALTTATSRFTATATTTMRTLASWVGVTPASSSSGDDQQHLRRSTVLSSCSSSGSRAVFARSSGAWQVP
jgi:hypothetical protein